MAEAVSGTGAPVPGRCCVVGSAARALSCAVGTLLEAVDGTLALQSVPLLGLR